jgi:hypothetical protein
MTRAVGVSITHRSARTRQVRALAAALLLLPSATGCYTYAPVWNGVVEPGREVRVGLSDEGRVLLAPSLGAGANRIDGRVLEKSDSALSLAIAGVEYVNARGIFAKWSGEPVVIPRQVFAGVAERKLSRGRTWTLVALAAIAVGVASSRAITGGGNDPPGNKEPIGGQQQ